jgi:hypothetical protein
MKTKAMIVISCMALFNSSYAGMNGLTWHSRANCANNESIAWDWTRNWWLWTTSDHRDIRTGGSLHSMTTQWQNTWRSAAVHWGEGTGGYLVVGDHWLNNSNNQIIYLGHEAVTDCSIYDGWWDHNK